MTIALVSVIVGTTSISLAPSLTGWKKKTTPNKNSLFKFAVLRIQIHIIGSLVQRIYHLAKRNLAKTRTVVQRLVKSRKIISKIQSVLKNQKRLSLNVKFFKFSRH
jgi:hypothetical protein